MKLNSKRFVIRKSLIGKNAVITVNFTNGKTATYNHDKVYEVMKDKFIEPYPARATVQVAALPLGVDIEMDAIVFLDE